MAMEICILASGSGGNSTVLRWPGGVVLIDAGIGPRTTGKRLDGTGVGVEQVQAICLTHLDSDHFRPTWVRTIIKQGIRVFCHESRVDELMFVSGGQREFRQLVSTFNGAAFEPARGVKFGPIHLAHDDAGSHGFLVDGPGMRIGYATDLGRVPAELLEKFDGVDILALESNYDPDMQLTSARPEYLKRRIMGGRGHLSNEQAYDAVRAILNRCQKKGGRMPSHIVLLHRSRECNCPRLMRKFFGKDARIGARLTLAEQFERTEWLGIASRRAVVGEQLLIFDF